MFTNQYYLSPVQFPLDQYTVVSEDKMKWNVYNTRQTQSDNQKPRVSKDENTHNDFVHTFILI